MSIELNTEQADQVKAAGHRPSEVEGMMQCHGLSFEAALKQVIDNKEARRQLWLSQAVDPWAAKHGITREQAISILFFDNTIEGPYLKTAYWAEASDFAMITMAGKPTPFGLIEA